jgi:glucose dehydrogenase
MGVGSLQFWRSSGKCRFITGVPISYDAELGLLIVGTGIANPDMDGRGRPGDNLQVLHDSIVTESVDLIK